MSDEETAARAEVRLQPLSRPDRVRALRADGWWLVAERCGVWQAVKNEGNELFKESHFADALEKYNQAIDLNPEVPTYYCNRAFCHTKMENHGLAIEDAGGARALP